MFRRHPHIILGQWKTLRKALLKAQQKKFYKLIQAINKGINIFDPKNPLKFNKSAISRILDPTKTTKNMSKSTNEFLKNIKERMLEELKRKNIDIVREDDLKKRLNVPIPYKKVERIEKYPCYVYRIAKEEEIPEKYIHGVPYVFDRFEKEPEKI